jgi:hypothetical protein
VLGDLVDELARGEAVVAELAGGDGALRWRTMISGERLGIGGLASAPSGEVVVGGEVSGLLAAGAQAARCGGSRPQADVDVTLTCAFVAVFAGDGAARRLQVFGTYGHNVTQRVIADAGGVVLFGHAGELDLGGGPIGVPSFNNTFIASLGPGGEHRWSQVLYDGSLYGPTLASGADGAVYLAAVYDGKLRVGAYELPNGEWDSPPVMLAAFDASGRVMWVETLPQVTGMVPVGLRVRADGLLSLAARSDGRTTVGVRREAGAIAVMTIDPRASVPRVAAP